MSAEELWNKTCDNDAFKTECIKTYETAVKRGIEILCPEDVGYPEELKQLYAPPVCLYYLGKMPERERIRVAVVGARNCTDYGVRMAEYFAKGLAKHGIDVISGMAAGIDGVAQRAVLDNGGTSYAVLGSGVDIVYPGVNRDIYERLKKNGGLLSEIPPGGAPRAANFPARNRILAGLSDAVLVIEAAFRSGSLITVNYGLELGKEIMAVPGRIDDVMSAGCLDVIKSGATPVTSVNDVLYVLSTIKRTKQKCE
jgi:DNA processing protein